MSKPKPLFIEITEYLFIFLFLYTAYFKVADHENFSHVLSKSPAISSFIAPILAWAIPFSEILTACFLLIPWTRKTGLWLSFLLMLLFTAYLGYMLMSGKPLPCNCGGVISALTWKQHLLFNLFFLATAASAIYFEQKNGPNIKPGPLRVQGLDYTT